MRAVTVESELQEDADFIARIKPADGDLLVAAANHNEAFSRFLKETDWRHDPTNADVYLETNLWARRQIKADPSAVPAVHEYALRKRSSDGLDGVTFLARSDKYLVAGVDVAGHGDKGPNGSRNSMSGHIRSARKIANADGHSPWKREGVIQAGTCLAMKPLPPKYTRGSYTSWAAAHGVIYQGGKTTHVFVRNGKWRGGDRRPVDKQRRPHQHQQAA